jgi:hypothetical protein
MYDISVGVFSARLQALASVLTAAEQNAGERKIDPQVFLTARLAPDMFALTRQVQIATDHAKGAPSRLAGREVPKYEDNEASFAELQARIAKTLDHLATFTAADLEGRRTGRSKCGSEAARPRCPGCNICCTWRCRISISTSQRPTTSCATMACRSASRRFWEIVDF